MKKNLFVVVFAICCGVLFIATATRPAHATREIHQEISTPTPTRTATATAMPIPLFVGIGQSNMAGGLVIDGNTVRPIVTNVKMMKHDTNPLNHIWNWDSNMQEPSNVWQYDPTHTPSAKFAKYGPATSFMQQIMVLQEGKPGWSQANFINCAVGGSPVGSWAPTPTVGVGTHTPTPNATWQPNLDNCWGRIHAALVGGKYYVAGLVIINGESDTKNANYSGNYKTNFTNSYNVFDQRIRTLHNPLNMAHVPMVFARLGNKPAHDTTLPYPYWDNIRQHQWDLTETSNYWTLVETENLDRQTDAGEPIDLHYTQAGYDTLGINLANALEPLLTTPTFTPTRTPTRTATITPTPISTTFHSIATQDGFILESSETSGVGGGTPNNSNSTFWLGDDASDKQYRSIISFGTASLPDDAVIISAVVRIKYSSTTGDNLFAAPFDIDDILVDMKTGTFNNSTNLETADFAVAADETSVGSFNTTPSDGWYSLTLNSAGRDAINTSTGGTQFRLRFALDDNDDGSADIMKFFADDYDSDDNGVGDYPPELIVTYYVP